MGYKSQSQGVVPCNIKMKMLSFRSTNNKSLLAREGGRGGGYFQDADNHEDVVMGGMESKITIKIYK